MPFTYFTTSRTLALMQIVRALGVNFRHLLHLRSEIQLEPGGLVLRPEETYRCSYRLRDIVRLRADRAALVVKTDVHDRGGRLMLSEQDYFIIRNLPQRSVDALDGPTPLARRSAAACGSWEATSAVRARRSYPLTFALAESSFAPES